MSTKTCISLLTFPTIAIKFISTNIILFNFFPNLSLNAYFNFYLVFDVNLMKKNPWKLKKWTFLTVVISGLPVCPVLFLRGCHGSRHLSIDPFLSIAAWRIHYSVFNEFCCKIYHRQRRNVIYIDRLSGCHIWINTRRFIDLFLTKIFLSSGFSPSSCVDYLLIDWMIYSLIIVDKWQILQLSPLSKYLLF